MGLNFYCKTLHTDVFPQVATRTTASRKHFHRLPTWWILSTLIFNIFTLLYSETIYFHAFFLKITQFKFIIWAQMLMAVFIFGLLISRSNQFLIVRLPYCKELSRRKKFYWMSSCWANKLIFIIYVSIKHFFILNRNHKHNRISQIW